MSLPWSTRWLVVPLVSAALLGSAGCSPPVPSHSLPSEPTPAITASVTSTPTERDDLSESGSEPESYPSPTRGGPEEKPNAAQVLLGLRELVNQVGEQAPSEEKLEPYYDCVADRLHDSVDSDALHEIADGNLPTNAIGPLREAVWDCLDEHGEKHPS